jgi:hypothetical protein
VQSDHEVIQYVCASLPIAWGTFTRSSRRASKPIDAPGTNEIPIWRWALGAQNARGSDRFKSRREIAAALTR